MAEICIPGYAVVPPNPDMLAPTSMESSVTQYGITWTFGTTYEVGQFVTGDYFVVDPGSGVTVSSVSPGWDGVDNGSMLNPSIGGPHGYDSKVRSGFSAAARATFPLSASSGDSVVSTIGLSAAGVGTEWDGTAVDSKACIDACAVLTVVSSAPYADAFRPSYTDTLNTIYRTSQIDENILPNLSTSGMSIPSISTAERAFERPWLLHVVEWESRDVHPAGSMYAYHRDIGSRLSINLAMICSDLRTEMLLHRFIQVMIDYYHSVFSATSGCTRTLATAWCTDTSSWAVPMVIAGCIMGESNWYNVMSTFSGWTRDTEKTYYSSGQFTTQTSAIITTGQVWSGWQPPVFFRKETDAEYEHMHPTEWGSTPDPGTGEAYKECCDMYPMVGMHMAGKLIDDNTVTYDIATLMDSAQAGFDMSKRWMEESPTVYDGTGWSAPSTMGSSGTDLIDSMWAAYI